ncbi:MAG: lyase family protein [Acidobacteria bacterium]|jgi:aspartate ammonia-lyase|nr:lyase family protein [Acidobacteriota bacterium]
MRSESDLLGTIEVPGDALFGSQTQRAIENFPLLGQRSIGNYPTLIQALLTIKKAAAIVNGEIGCLEAPIAGAIQAAADRVLAEKRFDQFPVHFLHGGGGTSANMNANEVLANQAEVLLGGRCGEYRRVHPNEHVNMNQSTNDVYPTACHMAILRAYPPLRSVLEVLRDVLLAKGREFQHTQHLARTCYQDAVDITFADFFGGYAAFVNRSLSRLNLAVAALHSVNLGGTIVGRAGDVPAEYNRRIIPLLRRVTGDEGFHQPESLFDAAQNADEMVNVSSQLDLLARGLLKIAQDLRVLSSGPEAGLGELLVPAVQPGSSIMPGKVNPVIPEFMIQVAFKVMGNHSTCSLGLNHGELDLNVWESSMVFSILDSMELLGSGIDALTRRCLAGIRVDGRINAGHADSIIPRLTRLMHRFGYQRVNDVCKKAGGDLPVLKKLLDQTFGK